MVDMHPSNEDRRPIVRDIYNRSTTEEVQTVFYSPKRADAMLEAINVQLRELTADARYTYRSRVENGTGSKSSGRGH